MSAFDWQEQAACLGTDPEAFFPVAGTPNSHNRAALRICENCEVKVECTAHAAIFNEKTGIWGGEDTATRRRGRRQIA